MALTISDVIEKLLDNANVGKVVTDVGSGFALAISMVLGIGLVTGISVIPLDQSKALDAKLSHETYVLCVDKAELAVPLQHATDILKLSTSVAKVECRETPISIDDADAKKAVQAADELYRLSERRIAVLAAQLNAFDTRIAALTKPATANRASYEPVIKEREPIAKAHDELVSQKDVIDIQQQRVSTLQNQQADARAFLINIEGFTNNLSAVLAFSVVLGVLLSQLNRLIIVTWIYDAIIARRHPHLARRSPKARALNKTEYDELITNYYRYVEGAINMIVPVVAFGLIVPRFVNERLVAVAGLEQVFAAFVSVAIASLLGIAGYVTYKAFRQREAQIIELKISEPEI